MSASTQDIGLTIIRGGIKAFYAGVKGCGVLIWDIRTGLFEPDAPPQDPHHVLDWISESDWYDCVELLASPLADPVYGYVTIDFDNKVVIDQNGYGKSDTMYFDWLFSSLKDAANGDDGLVPSASLKEHLKHGRILITDQPRPSDDTLTVLAAKTIKAAALECKGKVEACRARGDVGPTWAVLKAPVGWTFKCVDR